MHSRRYDFRHNMFYRPLNERNLTPWLYFEWKSNDLRSDYSMLPYGVGGMMWIIMMVIHTPFSSVFDAGASESIRIVRRQW